MLKITITALALIALPTAPALAQEAEMPAVETPAAEAPAPARTGTIREGDVSPDDTKIKCRKIKTIGTRFQKKECKSEAAWEHWDDMNLENGKAAADRFQRNATSGAVGG